MKTIGIIAEYNPFHSGHAYQIAEIRKRFGADYIIVAMSGDFVQRGAPAIIDKYARTRMALSCGADLVIELPVLWSTASAELFAMAGVTLLEKTGCVDGICFGAETDDLPLLTSLADVLAEEPAPYREALSSYLKEGLTFPQARARSLCGYLSRSVGAPEEIASILNEPNNILAIEYLKALKRRHSPLTPYLIRREGAGYHEANIVQLTVPRNDMSERGLAAAPTASATAIRKLLLDGASGGSPDLATAPDLPAAPDLATACDPAAARGLTAAPTASATAIRKLMLGGASGGSPLSSAMPPEAYAILYDYLRAYATLREDDFSSVLGYLLLCRTREDLAMTADSNIHIANRLKKNLSLFDSFSGFCAANKSRDITYARLSRILMHLLLELTNDDYDLGKKADYIPYLRILGFRRASVPLLGALKRNATAPVIGKLADARASLSDEASAILEKDIFAADLYDQMLSQTTNRQKACFADLSGARQQDAHFADFSGDRPQDTRFADFSGSQKKTTPRSEYTREIVLV